MASAERMQLKIGDRTIRNGEEGKEGALYCIGIMTVRGRRKLR